MFDYAMIWIAVAVLVALPVFLPWWINRCDQIGIEKAHKRELAERLAEKIP